MISHVRSRKEIFFWLSQDDAKPEGSRPAAKVAFGKFAPNEFVIKSMSGPAALLHPNLFPFYPTFACFDV